MEATFKANLEEAAQTVQSAADAITNYDALETRAEDIAASLGAIAGRLRELSENPGCVVLVGNPIDGMRIVGPWLDANDAGDDARETVDDHWTVATLKNPENLEG